MCALKVATYDNTLVADLERLQAYISFSSSFMKKRDYSLSDLKSFFKNNSDIEKLVESISAKVKASLLKSYWNSEDLHLPIKDILKRIKPTGEGNFSPSTLAQFEKYIAQFEKVKSFEYEKFGIKKGDQARDFAYNISVLSEDAKKAKVVMERREKELKAIEREFGEDYAEKRNYEALARLMKINQEFEDVAAPFLSAYNSVVGQADAISSKDFNFSSNFANDFLKTPDTILSAYEEMLAQESKLTYGDQDSQVFRRFVEVTDEQGKEKLVEKEDQPLAFPRQAFLLNLQSQTQPENEFQTMAKLFLTNDNLVILQKFDRALQKAYKENPAVTEVFTMDNRQVKKYVKDVLDKKGEGLTEFENYLLVNIPKLADLSKLLEKDSRAVAFFVRARAEQFLRERAYKALNSDELSKIDQLRSILLHIALERQRSSENQAVKFNDEQREVFKSFLKMSDYQELKKLKGSEQWLKTHGNVAKAYVTATDFAFPLTLAGARRLSEESSVFNFYLMAGAGMLDAGSWILFKCGVRTVIGTVRGASLGVRTAIQTLRTQGLREGLSDLVPILIDAAPLTARELLRLTPTLARGAVAGLVLYHPYKKLATILDDKSGAYSTYDKTVAVATFTKEALIAAGLFSSSVAEAVHSTAYRLTLPTFRNFEAFSTQSFFETRILTKLADEGIEVGLSIQKEVQTAAQRLAQMPRSALTLENIGTVLKSLGEKIGSDELIALAKQPQNFIDLFSLKVLREGIILAFAVWNADIDIEKTKEFQDQYEKFVPEKWKPGLDPFKDVVSKEQFVLYRWQYEKLQEIYPQLSNVRNRITFEEFLLERVTFRFSKEQDFGSWLRFALLDKEKE